MSEIKLELSYFTGEEIEQFPFLRLPKMRFSDPRFQGISNDCKLLYTFMLDRVSLSITNEWRDKRGGFTSSTPWKRRACFWVKPHVPSAP